MVAVSAIAATTLAACGSGGASASGKTLSMWTFKQSHVAALQNIAKGFTKQTGITVNITAYTPDDAFGTKVQAAAKTKDLPDLLEVHTNGDDFAFGGSGLLTDLSSDVNSAWAQKYLPQVRNDGTVTQQYYKGSVDPTSKTHGIKLGQRYSVPLTIGTFGIVYANKERLTAAGITKAPVTWEEFVADLAAVQKKNPTNSGISLGLKAPSTGLEWFMQPMAYSLLGKKDFEALYSDNAATNWASATGKKVLDKYGQISPYWMPGTQTLDIDGADLAFAQGKSTFDIGGTFTLAFLAQNGFKPDNVLSFAVPAPAGGVVSQTALSPFALTGLSISSTTKNKEGAIKWLQYLAQPDVATQFAKDALDLPPVDLGSDPNGAVGPVLGSMIKSFGSGDQAYNPGYTAYRPNAYDAGVVGSALMNYTPLKQTDSATTGRKLAELIHSYWVKQ
jgi:multiple sugar transport system substrate-binding protein